MRVVLFCHSLLSDYKHESAHFLRGVVSELVERGHRVRTFEPENAWSVQKLVREQGEEALMLVPEHCPAVQPCRYDPGRLDLDEVLGEADLVIVHEWNAADLVRRIGAHRKRSSSYTLLFHDTRHRRGITPGEISACDLSGYDGVLASFAALKHGYERAGWGPRAFLWHEAVDVRICKPSPLSIAAVDVAAGPDSRRVAMRGDVVWIGTWGDAEHTNELRELFLEPARDQRLVAKAFGAGYPAYARRELERHGVKYGGWLPDVHVPRAFAAYKMTVYVPHPAETSAWPAVPTIGFFEALACGAPLVSGAGIDGDGLFQAGTDYLVAKNGDEMRCHMRLLLSDPDARVELARHAREAILARHTCAHRVDQLLSIIGALTQTSAGADRLTASVVDSRPNVALGVFL
ncbi:MAG TPA: glycosyltransferase [Labilithrix sp.]|nr:glycosyltransferase [Labilithrix sp.]